MTRPELETLRKAITALRDGNGYLCLAYMRRLEIDAEAENAIEDAWHDRPINMEDSTHGSH
jgi:hypothetical protein